MKNLVWALTVLGIGLGILGTSSCKKECDVDDCECNNNCVVDSIRYNLSALTDTAVGLKTDAEIIAKVHFTNTSSLDPAAMIWEVSEETLPVGWNRAVCDNYQCWSPTVADTTMTLTATDNAGFDFKVNFYPNGIRGNGTVKVHIYAPSDSAATSKTVIFHAIAND